jgi:RNA polymerase sigma-70 factor (ECF subfamily)
VRWMCTIARFEIMNHIRQAHRAEQMFEASIIEQIADCHAEHAEQLEARHEALKGCLQRLPARQRDLLSLRYWRGLSIKEIAAWFGQEAGATHAALSRIRKGLERCIDVNVRQEGHAR